MTVVLGRRSGVAVSATPPACPGLRRDLTWEQRRANYYKTHFSPVEDFWQPEPRPVEAPLVIEIAPQPDPDPVRPGLLWLYAARIAHARLDASSLRRAAPGQRLLVGAATEDEGAARPMAVVGVAEPFGRSDRQHYQRLHPVVPMRYGRLRCGGNPMSARQRPTVASHSQFVSGLRSGVAPAPRPRLAYARIGASKRLMLASLCAILLIVSAASTSLAGQQRYEVRDGDTIESIADTFGVDPDAIRTSSYLPNGDALSAGQVVVIPEPGQSPTDAAQMAAANEGTSPWVATAYWVEWGDNPASIASDFGVDINDLMDLNGIEDPLNVDVGDRILIPDTATSVETNAAPEGTSSGGSLAVPNYKQQRNLSCEYAATHAAAMAFGWAPTEQQFIDAVPEALNPHYGYRGNIDGWWGNTQDYGIYAEPLVPVLNDWGFNGEVIYTFGDTGPLIEHLDAGHPVVTWLGFWGNTRERLTDDGNYSVFAGMHVVTVYDYDDEGVWVMDPAKGAKVHYSWDFFIKMWSVIDGMSLAVYPY